MTTKLAFALLIPLMAFGQAPKTPRAADPYEHWGRLRDYKVHGTVTVVLKADRKCYELTDITGVTDHDIIVRAPGGDSYVLEDKEVLLIATGLHFSDIGISDYLLSARSSWLDVKKFTSSTERGVRVTMKDGKKVDGELVSVADDSLTLREKKKAPATIAKEAIQKIEIIRQKPMPKALAAMNQETPWMVPLNPQSYPYLMHWNDTIRVRVYEASLPEDNEALKCGEK